MRTETAQPIRLQDYRAPDWVIEHVELDVALDPAKTRVRAKLTIKPSPHAASPAPLVLDGDELTLKGLSIDGQSLGADSYTASPDALTILQPPQRKFVLEIETQIDPSSNTKLMGLYRSNGTYCTQCEAEGFRRITYFLDRPDVMATYTTRIEAEKKEVPHLLANGNLISSGDIAATTRHFAVWHDPFPKPSYLFAMVGGDLGFIEDTFVTASGR
ncbi:MAG: aminopeptidase N, partial [Xanthobacteraceae bacterium]